MQYHVIYIWPRCYGTWLHVWLMFGTHNWNTKPPNWWLSAMFRWHCQSSLLLSHENGVVTWWQKTCHIFRQQQFLLSWKQCIRRLWFKLLCNSGSLVVWSGIMHCRSTKLCIQACDFCSQSKRTLPVADAEMSKKSELMQHNHWLW